MGKIRQAKDELEGQSLKYIYEVVPKNNAEVQFSINNSLSINKGKQDHI